MLRATRERILGAEQIDELFEATLARQYTQELLFSTVLGGDEFFLDFLVSFARRINDFIIHQSASRPYKILMELKKVADSLTGKVVD